MFVVVYLIAPKGKLIVPQEWLKDFNQETVNNIGKASYQNRRIFWSKIGVDADGIPDSSIRPNFNRNKSLVFPPSSDDACYDARVLCYCATRARAIYYRDTFRPLLPVLYNVQKQFDKPLPPMPSNYRNANSLDSLGQNNIPTEPQFEPVAGPSTVHNAARNENPDVAFSDSIACDFVLIEPRSSIIHNTPRNVNSDIVHEEPEQEEQDLVNQSTDESLPFEEAKYIMPNVELDDTDMLEISHVFHDEQTNDQQARICTSELNDNESIFLENGVMKIKKVVDDDCEMVYTYGTKIVPYVGFEVKLNDPVSMNIPFNENVSIRLQSM